MTNLKETFGIGATVALGLFMLFYFMQLQAADSPAEAVDVFARPLLVILFIFVPTSEIGAIISVVAEAIGAAISVDSVGSKPAAIVAVFGFFYTLTNIIINWFTVPV